MKRVKDEASRILQQGSQIRSNGYEMKGREQVRSIITRGLPTESAVPPPIFLSLSPSLLSPVSGRGP